MGRAILMMVMAAMPLSAWAHGGGLDAQGCHHNRRTGDYHCHGGYRADPVREPVRAEPVMFLGGFGGASGSHAFRNCTAARQAGAAPVRRGDPGYGPHLDRDNDGVGCE